MWLLILACGTQEPVPSGCGDVEDPAGSILELWALNESEAIRRVLDCNDPPLQMELVEVLVEAHPGRSMSLCEGLQDSAVRDRCVQLNSRPHLWEEALPVGAGHGRLGGGPASLHPDPSATSSNLPLVELDSICRAEIAQSTCLAGQARAHAHAGRPAHALAVCRKESELQWANECLFEAAEARQVSEAGSAESRYFDATELCLEGGEYRPFCLGHIHLQMAHNAPPADTPAGEAWEEHLSRGEIISRVWSARGDRAYGALAQDYFWSEVLWESISRSRLVVGNPQDFLPAEVLPHLRAAASYRLLADRALSGQSLAQAVGTIARVLEDRNTDDVVLSGPAPVRAEGRLWPQDGVNEGSVPALFYLGISRRAVDLDPEVDLSICVLEAAARQHPRRNDLLKQGREHAHPVVRWTAERLGH